MAPPVGTTAKVVKTCSVWAPVKRKSPETFLAEQNKIVFCSSRSSNKNHKSRSRNQGDGKFFFIFKVGKKTIMVEAKDVSKRLTPLVAAGVVCCGCRGCRGCVCASSCCIFSAMTRAHRAKLTVGTEPENSQSVGLLLMHHHSNREPYEIRAITVVVTCSYFLFGHIFIRSTCMQRSRRCRKTETTKR